MRLLLALASLALTVFSTARVHAEDTFGWRDADGKPLPDTESRKSSKGFGGSMLLTPDKDWREKWERAENPSYTTTEDVRLGETVMALVFFVNPANDKGGNIHIDCHFKVTRPDGSISQDHDLAPCAEGKLEGDPYDLRLIQAAAGFMGEATDVPGEWTIQVKLTDQVRHATVDLVTRFEYQPVPRPARSEKSASH
jgi:hypothetical protein